MDCRISYRGRQCEDDAYKSETLKVETGQILVLTKKGQRDKRLETREEPGKEPKFLGSCTRKDSEVDGRVIQR